MPGSENVNRNLVLKMSQKLELAKEAMDVHIQNSASFARSNFPWEPKTGLAGTSIFGKTKMYVGGIKSSVSHGKNVPYGYWLEKRQDFHGAYRILEEARSNNLAMLWAALRRIFS